MPTPEEVLAEFTKMQQEKNKPTDAFAVTESDVPESTHSNDDTELDLIDSGGPSNPNEIMPAIDRLPHVPSTGPISPITDKTNVEVVDRRARVPNTFLQSIGVILKDAGADSMSQEKALARVAELLEYPKEPPVLTNPGIPAPIPPKATGETKVIHSEIPGHPHPESD